MAVAAPVDTDNLDPRRPADDWELSLGTVAERTARAGRSSLEFRAKTNQSDVRGDHLGGEWRAVRDLGQDAMKLVMGGPDSLDPVPRVGNGGGGFGVGEDEDEEVEDPDEPWSDDSDVEVLRAHPCWLANCSNQGSNSWKELLLSETRNQNICFQK